MDTQTPEVRTIVARLGGPKAVQEMTELSKGRISQWCTENHIPASWRKYLQEKHPEAFIPEPEAQNGEERASS